MLTNMRLDEAWLVWSYAHAMAYMLVLGDVSHFTEEMLSGHIELGDKVLFEHINAVMKQANKNAWYA